MLSNLRLHRSFTTDKFAVREVVSYQRACLPDGVVPNLVGDRRWGPVNLNVWVIGIEDGSVTGLLQVLIYNWLAESSNSAAALSVM